MLDIVITDGSVITGDGKTVLERAVVGVAAGLIAGLGPVDAAACIDDGSTLRLDARGAIVLPGLINAHAHGCVHGPSMPSGSLPCRDDDIGYFRSRHLLAGTTTLLNVCGLALCDEIDPPGRENCTMDIRVSTAHTPCNLKAAQAVDGAGLNGRHLDMTIDRMLADGAAALGEVGGGQTLGGGAQEYRFIPQAIRAAIGVDITPYAARRLKQAVVGRHLDPSACLSDIALEEEIAEAGLTGRCDAAMLKRVIVASVMPPVGLALTGFEEMGREAARVGYPAIFHNALPSISRLLDVAHANPGARIIAAHSNHPSFESDEAVEYASKLRRAGVIIDVSTLDCVTTRWRNDARNLDALIEADLVDTISTDFAGGHWDAMLEAIHRMVHRKQKSPAAAVAMATGNVARIFPQLAGDRGLIEKGRRADLIIVDAANMARVRHVIIAGRIVIRDGIPG